MVKLLCRNVFYRRENMKRKLLIVALMATVLVFVLAFSSSAAATGSTSNE